MKKFEANKKSLLTNIFYMELLTLSLETKAALKREEH